MTDVSMQVLSALPHLQTLDDIRLSRPLSPLSKIAAAHRHAANSHAANSHAANSHAAPVSHPAHAPASTSGLITANQLYPATYRPASLAQATDCVSALYPLHTNTDSSNTFRMSRSSQRPASAGGVPQRLPPVASGRNQPGSYLLHSLAHSIVANPLLRALGDTSEASETLMDQQMAASMLRSREELIAQLCSSEGGKHLGAFVTEDMPDGQSSSKMGQSRPVRPGSAGFRRPDAALSSHDRDASR